MEVGRAISAGAEDGPALRHHALRSRLDQPSAKRNDLDMKRPLRWFWRIPATMAVFVGLLWLIEAQRWDVLARRELYRTGMAVGFIPKSTGSFRYQVMGLNVPQPPEWVEWGVSIGTALIAVAPAFLVVIGVYHWMTFRGSGDGQTRCGACGGVLKGLSVPRCNHCQGRI